MTARERETCPFCGIMRKTSERGAWIGAGGNRQFHHHACIVKRIAELDVKCNRLTTTVKQVKKWRERCILEDGDRGGTVETAGPCEFTELDEILAEGL